MKGSLKTANSIADALTLQLYEEQDLNKASFNHKLGESDWEKIGEIVDTYSDVLFTAKAISTNVAHPLLKEIKNGNLFRSAMLFQHCLERQLVLQ